MQFPSFSHPVTGIAIPVGALKTAQSCGIGEFLDLIPFADFCKKAGVDMIQLLPINDTGTESSPYSALSAFALHPAYINLEELPEAETFSSEIRELRAAHEGEERFDYRGIRNAKLELLHRIYDVSERNIMERKDLAEWIDENPWIVEYAVFMNLKRRNFDASWKSWDKMRTPTHAEIQDRWLSPARKPEHLFFAWVQMCLERQLSIAVKHCANRGIAIKGDIPIMMNEDSCDAWANPEFFRDDLRAGSPPDSTNPLGQNWGFPIYNWDNLRADGFGWWKARLRRSAKFFHAYRIDHILGFFRIWSIPNGEPTGYLGWTTPHEPITAPELAELGFSGDRLRWICAPHVPTRAIEEVNNHDYLGSHGILRQLMERIGTEELWLFRDEVRCEGDIANYAIPDAVKNVLRGAWKDRLMQITGRDDRGKALYSPIWNYRESTAWKSLTDPERDALRNLIEEKERRSERLWKEQAEELLGALTREVDMLPCAEDLGSVPAIVPGVLSDLGILGLKVVRWERKWAEQGQPFRDISEYPRLSVATTSVHDSTTLRGWWENEGGAADFLAYRTPEADGYPSGTSAAFARGYGTETAAWLLKILARANSDVLSVPIQDFLALVDDYAPKDANSERVNVPGSVNAFNWTYRIPATVEKLAKNKKLITAIADALKERRARPSAKGASK